MLCSIIFLPNSDDSGSLIKILSGTAIFKFESKFIIFDYFDCKYNSITINYKNEFIIIVQKLTKI
ncbi:hypothetical protein GCM10011531_24820 [Aquaticitalea lipolytica]|uniref:Uncharacterized protein n=1 Tax=Aquaticitalea lipolytica TaxID=1247562 RepID=A0A8J2TT01_9FLAO|nr:hypothetical protein GCM10011531_24820 [Aquaticitalea lipolytica]